MPTDEVFAVVDPPEEESLDPKFEDVGYEATSLILNLGTMFLTLLVMLLIPLCLLASKPFKNKSRWFSKKHESLARSASGNMFIRYMLEGCLDIVICAVLNFVNDMDSEDGMMWDSIFLKINNVSLIVLGIAVAIFPLWVLIFYCKNFARWNDENFESKYGAVFEGLRTDRRSALAYPIIFLTRRSVFITIAYVTQKMYVVQLGTMTIISIG